jgi:cytochrome bd-type quinol oxidase subunit 2
MAEPNATQTPEDPMAQHTGRGPGRLLVAVYGLLALAATGRSVLQISEYFERAPLAYILSAVAAVIYIVATVGLARGNRASVRVAAVAVTIELIGVLVVGAISYAVPEAFPDKTVWSHFGQGYGYVPLVLPVLGLLWIRRHRGVSTTAPNQDGEGRR